MEKIDVKTDIVGIQRKGYNNFAEFSLITIGIRIYI